MNCPACGFHNGDFTVRCQNCGQLLVELKDPSTPRPGHPSRLTYVFAITSVLCGLGLLGLVVVITSQGMWDQMTSNVPSEPAFKGIRTPGLQPEPMLIATPTSLPHPMRPASLTVGQLGSSDVWHFAVEKVRYTSNDTTNGWNGALVTFVLQNSGTRVATLDVPSTARDTAPGPSASAPTPGFVPDSRTHDVSPETVGGLRLFLVDGQDHEYGGGFGDGMTNFRIHAPPGDVLRLTYKFLFPSNQPKPTILRASFPLSSGGDTFEVHLDQNSTPPVDPRNAVSASDVPMGDWATIANEWSVALEGIEFGPPPVGGEQRVTVHLDVHNLSSAIRPALTDVNDLQGTLRDFYLLDSAGHIAYSQVGDLPTVDVPGNSEREVSVHLATTDLLASSRPLRFVAVLNSRDNRYLRFVVP